MFYTYFFPQTDLKAGRLREYLTEAKKRLKNEPDRDFNERSKRAKMKIRIKA